MPDRRGEWTDKENAEQWEIERRFAEEEKVTQMDPDANLKEQREIIQRSNGTGVLTRHDAARLIELVESLDRWITRGGFLPAAWKKGQNS